MTQMKTYVFYPQFHESEILLVVLMLIEERQTSLHGLAKALIDALVCFDVRLEPANVAKVQLQWIVMVGWL